MRSFKLLFFSFILLVSCSDGEGLIDVDPEFQVFVDEFVEEAANRGIEIDFRDTGLSVQFSDFALHDIGGFCRLSSHMIEINKEDWFALSPSRRSQLLFHELGHCELRRGHTNDKLTDLSWISLMRGRPFDGIEENLPVPFFGFRRDYYIDELFDPNTPAPDWANISFDPNVDFPKELIDSNSDVNRINSFPQLSDEDYEIDVEFELIESPGIRITLEWGVQGANYYLTIIPGFGFFSGVRDAGLDFPLHYRANYNDFNGRPIEQITIRRHEGFEQIFVNGEQFFLLDVQEGLDFVSLSAVRRDQRLDNFKIEDFSVSRITR